MRIFIPDMELMETLTFARELTAKVPEDHEVIFDFSKIKTFDPLSMLIMGPIIRSYKNKYPEVSFMIDGTDAYDRDYTETMGFFKYLSGALGTSKMPEETGGNTNYIPITPIVVSKLREAELANGNYLVLGDLLEKEAGRLAHILDQGNHEFHKLLTYLIREILRNAPEHGNANTMWICGQYLPSLKLAEIAISDEGIGIFNSLAQNPAHQEYITDHEKALRWVLKAGISKAFGPSMKQKSSDEWANSGFGLYMVKEICRHLNGSFCIISYGNYMLIDHHGISCGETSYHGTAVKMSVPSKEVSNAQSIISAIASQGEAEARTIRNAFKKASVPSKRLMSDLEIE